MAEDKDKVVTEDEVKEETSSKEEEKVERGILDGFLDSKLKSKDTGTKIQMIAGICILLISMIVAFSSCTSHNYTLGQQEAKLAQVNKELSEVASSSAITEDDVSDEEAVNSVKTEGDKIASLQNNYRRLAMESYASDSEANYNAMNDIVDELAVYFGKGSVLNGLWYNGDDTMINNGSWKFLSSYDFTGDSIGVLWEFTDDANVVLSYVTADYHAKTNTFDNANKHMTVAGAAYIATTNDSGYDESLEMTDEETVDDVASMMGTMESSVTYEESEERDEAMEDIHAYRDAYNAAKAGE